MKPQEEQLELRLKVPRSLAREAQARGLLEPECLAALLREALRQQRLDHLFSAADRLADLGEPPLSESEIEAEIQAARQQRLAH